MTFAPCARACCAIVAAPSESLGATTSTVAPEESACAAWEFCSSCVAARNVSTVQSRQASSRLIWKFGTSEDG